MRTFMLAVTGLVFAVAACSSYGTSVVEVGKTKAQVASVSLTVPSSLAAGKTARAIATPKDANGTALSDRPVTWFTSSASIASLSDSGMISAVAPGTAVVSAVSEGIAGQATMAVVPPPPTPIATVLVAVNPSAVVVGQAALATATLADSSGNLLFSQPVKGTFNSGPAGFRNVVHNPGFDNWNAGLFKKFQFTEKTGMQFRAEAFDVTNHPNWGGASFNPTNLSTFGKITSKTGDRRNMQLSLRLFF